MLPEYPPMRRQHFGSWYHTFEYYEPAICNMAGSKIKYSFTGVRNTLYVSNRPHMDFRYLECSYRWVLNSFGMWLNSTRRFKNKKSIFQLHEERTSFMSTKGIRKCSWGMSKSNFVRFWAAKEGKISNCMNNVRRIHKWGQNHLSM